MNDIKVAMIANGDVFVHGDRVRVIDGGGEEHVGTFLRCHPHNMNPEWMVIRYRDDEKEKHAVVGTNAELIEKVV